MATLNVPQNGKAVKGKTLKTAPSVDLTAMVDLAFLLITFFMLTTSLAKMQALDMAKPVPIENDKQRQAYPASRTMTILLGKNNQMVYYMGEVKNAAMKTGSLAILKKELLFNKKMVAQLYHGNKEKDLIVIIKPTQTAVYKNFVDMIDELHINGIEKYAIDDKYISPTEIAFMKAKGL